jgi:N-acetylglucosaminyldiphosphoundecaprenol N-acetyl-beta-D-mannosaminyltransferase
MGIDFNGVGEQDLIDYLLTTIEFGQGGWLVNPNVDCLRRCARDRSIRKLVQEADLVVPDGVPLVWAARLQGAQVPDRVAGSTLIWSLTRQAAQRDVGCFLLGGTDDDMASAAAARLAEAAPGLRIGHHVPPFGFEESELARRRISETLTAFGPAIVFCGLGFPKQERLMVRLSAEFPGSWFVGAGASISFAAGRVERAPRWMQDRGLEWMYRLRVEPRRLARRYLIEDLPFAARMFTRSALGSRRRHARPRVWVDRD